jgi:glycosyltransferase involved in cell wall biosynthesis
VAYIHEVLGPIWRSFYRPPISTLGRWQERLVIRMYRDVPFWVPSTTTGNILRHYGVRSVFQSANGTDVVPPAALEAKPLEAPLRLISLSRLEPNKRVEHCIKMMSLLREFGIQAHLTILGGGRSESDLRRLVKQEHLEEQVSLLGHISDSERNAKLRQAHALLHTSVREGWGLNVIEANAVGTPAVVYPVGGLVDSTVHNVTGLVTPQETPRSLAETLKSLCSDPGHYGQMRINAWNHAKTFQWDQCLPKLCSWLEDQACGWAAGGAGRAKRLDASVRELYQGAPGS